MLDAAAGTDKTEIQDVVVAFLVQRLRAFLNSAFHADAFLAGHLNTKQLASFFKARHLRLGFLQVCRKCFPE